MLVFHACSTQCESTLLDIRFQEVVRSLLHPRWNCSRFLPLTKKVLINERVDAEMRYDYATLQIYEAWKKSAGVHKHIPSDNHLLSNHKKLKEESYILCQNSSLATFNAVATVSVQATAGMIAGTVTGPAVLQSHFPFK